MSPKVFDGKAFLLRTSHFLRASSLRIALKPAVRRILRRYKLLHQKGAKNTACINLLSRVNKNF